RAAVRRAYAARPCRRTYRRSGAESAPGSIVEGLRRGGQQSHRYARRLLPARGAVAKSGAAPATVLRPGRRVLPPQPRLESAAGRAAMMAWLCADDCPGSVRKRPAPLVLQAPETG